MTSPDPRSPFVFDTRELGRRPGTMVELARSAAALDDLGTEIIAVPAGAPLELAVRFESVLEGVLVSGCVRARAVGSCVRCLDPVSLPVTAEIQELFAYPDRAAHRDEVGDDVDDERQLEGDLLDLEPVIRDVVVPALPFQPVCRSDCPGLCQECGARLADDPQHRHETGDPRWAVLAPLAQPAEGDLDRGQARPHHQHR